MKWCETSTEIPSLLIVTVYPNLGSACSLPSKRFQSSYSANVRAGAKKKWKGVGEGRRGNACPETQRFWKTPLDISQFSSLICKLTARQDR